MQQNGLKEHLGFLGIPHMKISMIFEHFFFFLIYEIKWVKVDEFTLKKIHMNIP